MTVSVHAPFDLVEAFTQRLTTFLGQQASQFRGVLTQTHSAGVQQFGALTRTYAGPLTLCRLGRSNDCIQLTRGCLGNHGEDFLRCRILYLDSGTLTLYELAIVINFHIQLPRLISFYCT
ncbi:hypothetical protein D3C84_454240 [compost metagenome]